MNTASSPAHYAEMSMELARLRTEDRRKDALIQRLQDRIDELQRASWGGHVWERLLDTQPYRCRGCGTEANAPHEVIATCEEMKTMVERTETRRQRQISGSRR